MRCPLVMHRSFVSPAPLGLGNSGAFNFSIFKARLKAWYSSEVKAWHFSPAVSPRAGDTNDWCIALAVVLGFKNIADGIQTKPYTFCRIL